MSNPRWILLHEKRKGCNFFYNIAKKKKLDHTGFDLEHFQPSSNPYLLPAKESRILTS